MHYVIFPNSVHFLFVTTVTVDKKWVNDTVHFNSMVPCACDCIFREMLCAGMGSSVGVPVIYRYRFTGKWQIFHYRFTGKWKSIYR
jgi:hypothetical protein